MHRPAIDHFPDTQAWHADAPGDESVPLGQVVQLFTVCPVWLLYIPAAQFKHAAWPPWLLYLPAGQLLHCVAPSSLYVPLGQAAQAAQSAQLESTVPAGHASQTGGEELTRPLVPGGHAWQRVPPPWDVWPKGQSAQAPPCGAVPGTHPPHQAASHVVYC
jgi:hypothetical protein